jgi:hypothetical protein
MSDENVIDRFVGKYESDGLKSNSDPNKRDYYPAKGVKLEIEKIPMTGKAGEAYAKVRVTNGDTFNAKLTLQRAIFRVVGNSLVAKDLELQAGLLFTETLTITKDDLQGNKEMLHELSFSDGALGTWICKN